MYKLEVALKLTNCHNRTTMGNTMSQTSSSKSQHGHGNLAVLSRIAANARSPWTDTFSVLDEYFLVN